MARFYTPSPVVWHGAKGFMSHMRIHHARSATEFKTYAEDVNDYVSGFTHTPVLCGKSFTKTAMDSVRAKDVADLQNYFRDLQQRGTAVVVHTIHDIEDGIYALYYPLTAAELSEFDSDF
jgi:hypothetical protein